MIKKPGKKKGLRIQFSSRLRSKTKINPKDSEWEINPSPLLFFSLSFLKSGVK
jgi:hypothetical protein